MKQARTLSKAELARVLRSIEQLSHADRNKTAFLLSFYAGLRVVEIASLKVGDVLDVDGPIKTYIALKAEQTKGDKGRTIVFSEKLKKALSSYISSLSENERNPLSPLIKSQKSKSAFSANSLCQLFGRIYKQAGLSGASSHSGRRTFITQLAHKGVSARVIMQIAGHRHLSTTQKYIDVNDEMLKEAVNII